MESFQIFSHRMELTYQGIRDYSPYINLNIVGETILKDHEIKTNSYELIIDCDFDSHAYYEVTSFGNNRITSRSSFTQSLNLLVHEHLKNNYNKKKPYFKFSRVIHIGYIDKDGIMDLILEIKGMRYLFLSNKHDFETKTIFHLEKVWRVENYVEF